MIAGVVLLSWSIRQCESIQGNARTFSEQVANDLANEGNRYAVVSRMSGKNDGSVDLWCDTQR